MSRKNFNKLSDWEKVYQLPLKYDDMGYAWSKNGTMALMFENIDNGDIHKIINTINGKQNFKIKGLNKDGCDFYQGKEYIFCVRGWGNLTGIGALNLPYEKACEIQDDFGRFIMERLNK